jgi:hypothetical protein
MPEKNLAIGSPANGFLGFLSGRLDISSSFSPSQCLGWKGWKHHFADLAVAAVSGGEGHVWTHSVCLESWVVQLDLAFGMAVMVGTAKAKEGDAKDNAQYGFVSCPALYALSRKIHMVDVIRRGF